VEKSVRFGEHVLIELAIVVGEGRDLGFFRDVGKNGSAFDHGAADVSVPALQLPPHLTAEYTVVRHVPVLNYYTLLSRLQFAWGNAPSDFLR
jgi:hypothetical protein